MLESALHNTGRATRLARLLLALALLQLGAAQVTAADTIVVCPASFRQALAPWLEFRQAQGHRIAIVPTAAAAAQVKAKIDSLAKSELPKFIVLVGDVPPANNASRAEGVPTFNPSAKIIRLLGHDTDIASDAPYADFDGDGLPDAAIGRLTVDSEQDLAIVVRKILAYERSPKAESWLRRINFVAGVGGFSPLADAALEQCAKKFITEKIPAAFRTTMTYASWSSPFCPDPRRFQQTVLQRLNEGSLFWVYIGHGQQRGLDWVRTPDNQYYPILACRDVGKLQCPQGPPIALFLACYTGAFDQLEDCLAEDLLRTPGAPVAVLSGSRVTMPYAMAVMGTEMLRECFVQRRPTIGEVLWHAKRSLVAGKRDDPESKALDFLAAILNLHSDLAAERAEHVLLFNLIGDPLLRIPHPAAVKVDIAKNAAPGGDLQVAGHCEFDGQATVELVVRRDRFATMPPSRPKFVAADAELTAFQSAYRRANDRTLATVTAPVVAGAFQTNLRVPDSAQGACHVRVMVQSQQAIGIGAANVEIKPAAVVGR